MLFRSEHDHAVYYKHLDNDHVAIIFIHVDDGTLVAPKLSIIQDLKLNIGKEVEIKDLPRHFREIHGMRNYHNYGEDCLWKGCSANVIQLSKHIRAVHLRTEDVSCPNCGKVVRKHHLTVHLQSCESARGAANRGNDDS